MCVLRNGPKIHEKIYVTCFDICFQFFFSHKEEWYLKVKSGSKNKFIMENYTPPIFNNFKTLTSRPLIKYYGDQDQTFSQLNPDLAASGK